MSRITWSRAALSWIVIPAVAGVTALYSCTPHEEPPEFAISPEPVKIAAETKADAEPKSYVEALEKVTGSSGKLYDAVADIRAMLKAEDLEREGKLKEATAQWFEALGIAQGPYGKRALEGWIKAYTKTLGKPIERDILAKLLMAEARNGHYGSYLSNRGINNEAALVPILEATVPDALIPLPPTTTAPSAMASAPNTPIPMNDPLLSKTATSYCKAKDLNVASWEAWQASLPVAAQPYWTALVLQCKSKDIEALKDFKAIYGNLISDKATIHWGLEALSRTVILERAIGVRSTAADLYIELMTLWDRPELTAKLLGLEPVELALRRINDTLWAGRYRAMITDYERGKVFAQSALTQITNAYSSQRQISGRQREALTSYKAEAYHDLAYRIALENNEFESALSLTMLALQTPGLTSEWRDRLQWFSGLYDYLGGHFEGAKRRWETMLANTKDESQRSMLFFWLSRAYAQLNQAEESQFYIRTLIEEYPLSYYAVVAAQMSAKDGKEGNDKTWQSVFGSYQDMVDRLVSRKDYGLNALRQNATFAPLLLRAEILVAAEIPEWSRITVNELDLKMNSSLSVQSNVLPFIYLSRLHYNAGNYLATIGITTKLSQAVPRFWRDWPEQLLVYFARPYSDVYERMASTLSIDKELLMAISRQESGFTADIRSSANAAGVMQLIRPTALRFAADAGIPSAKVDESLRDPEVNINLGSRYLKFLSLEYKGYPPAIFGAYNAGEAAVDIWLKRRAHSDPITFIELVPFGETKSYIRNVWRNVEVYRFLEGNVGGPTKLIGSSFSSSPRSDKLPPLRIEITPYNEKEIQASNEDPEVPPISAATP